MAPPPEYDKEPKAPDKSATNISSEDSKLLHNLINDQHTNSDHKPTNTAAAVEVENNKHVETLDDGQLRALLDEAITYKCPKDREGKSSLFKELLEEVEQDEQACEAAARVLPGGRGARRGRGRRALPHSNSLQDLVAALAAEPAPRRAHVRHAPAPAPSNVSARAIHGGSLPSGVDTSSMLSEEPARGAGYLATVRCVNPPPLAERRVSASDANAPGEMELLNRRSKPMFPMTYTARATLEIGSGSVCSGRAVTTTTPSNQVDSAISFSCITTPEVVSSCNTTSSAAQSAVAVDPKPRSVISSSFNGLPLSRPNYGSTGTSASDDYKKSLDENGNSVQGFSSPLSGSSQHKKPRRKKSSKNETVIDCQQIDGYQGDKDVNELLRFIESNADNGRGAKLGRVKHKDDSDDKSKKRSTERRKDKENKIKRATSMEELSRTKMEDLTDLPAPALRGDKKERRDAPAKERRSWGDGALYCEPHEPPDPAAELTDFQTVTKKRKPRRRHDEPPRRPPTAATTPTTTWTPCTRCRPPRRPRRPRRRPRPPTPTSRARATTSPTSSRAATSTPRGRARPAPRRPTPTATPRWSRAPSRRAAATSRRRAARSARRPRRPRGPAPRPTWWRTGARPSSCWTRPRARASWTASRSASTSTSSCWAATRAARAATCCATRPSPARAARPCARAASRCATCRPTRRATRRTCCRSWTTWAQRGRMWCGAAPARCATTASSARGLAPAQAARAPSRRRRAERTAPRTERTAPRTERTAPRTGALAARARSPTVGVSRCRANSRGLF